MAAPSDAPPARSTPWARLRTNLDTAMERADAPVYSTQYRQANRRSLSTRVHHNPYSLEDEAAASKRMHSYAALDYEDPNSDVHTLAQLKQTKAQQWHESFENWATFWALGVAVGIFAFLIKLAVENLTALKFATTQRALEHGSGAAFLAFLAISLCYGLLSSLLIVFVEKTAAGSGIPEVKAFLNGTNTPRFLTPLAGLVKIVGICFSVSSGLIIGREGPLIHIGAIIGNLVSTRPGAPKAWKRFRSDRHKRDFVSAGAAAGVAGAFSSPVGGICFAFEEASSFWRLSLTWRTFLCTMLTTSTQWGLSAAWKGQSSFWGFLKYGAFDHDSLFAIWEVPLLALLGLVGGFAGALFCGLNAKLSIWRASHVAPHRLRRVLEVLLIVALTATCSFWLPYTLAVCRDAPPNFHCRHTQNRYYCGAQQPLAVPAAHGCTEAYNCTDVAVYVQHGCAEGQFNTMGTLTFQNLDGVVHSFFHAPARFDKLSLLLYFVVTCACTHLILLLLSRAPRLLLVTIPPTPSHALSRPLTPSNASPLRQPLRADLLALVTYGCSVPSGLFVPCILMGSAYGRLWGEVMRDAFPAYPISPGVYALVGAASMLSGNGCGAPSTGLLTLE